MKFHAKFQRNFWDLALSMARISANFLLCQGSGIGAQQVAFRKNLIHKNDSDIPMQ